MFQLTVSLTQDGSIEVGPLDDFPDTETAKLFVLEASDALKAFAETFQSKLH